jgi:hypothetical protein
MIVISFCLGYGSNYESLSKANSEIEVLTKDLKDTIAKHNELNHKNLGLEADMELLRDSNLYLLDNCVIKTTTKSNLKAN